MADQQAAAEWSKDNLVVVGLLACWVATLVVVITLTTGPQYGAPPLRVSRFAYSLLQFNLLSPPLSTSLKSWEIHFKPKSYPFLFFVYCVAPKERPRCWLITPHVKQHEIKPPQKRQGSKSCWTGTLCCFRGRMVEWSYRSVRGSDFI